MGFDCSWYEVMDDPGCPKYGGLVHGDLLEAVYYDYPFDDGEGDENSIVETANDHCCHCKNAMISTPVSKYLDVSNQ